MDGWAWHVVRVGVPFSVRESLGKGNMGVTILIDRYSHIVHVMSYAIDLEHLPRKRNLVLSGRPLLVARHVRVA